MGNKFSFLDVINSIWPPFSSWLTPTGIFWTAVSSSSSTEGCYVIGGLCNYISSSPLLDPLAGWDPGQHISGRAFLPVISGEDIPRAPCGMWEVAQDKRKRPYITGHCWAMRKGTAVYVCVMLLIPATGMGFPGCFYLWDHVVYPETVAGHCLYASRHCPES